MFQHLSVFMRQQFETDSAAAAAAAAAIGCQTGQELSAQNLFWTSYDSKRIILKIVALPELIMSNIWCRPLLNWYFWLNVGLVVSRSYREGVTESYRTGCVNSFLPMFNRINRHLILTQRWLHSCFQSVSTRPYHERPQLSPRCLP